MNSIFSKNFIYLWTFHLFSIFGSELTRFAFPVWLFQQEENLFSYSVFMSFGLFPRILSPLAGSFLDIANKRKVLLASGLILIFVSITIFAIASGFLEKSFIFICLLMFVTGIFSNLIHIGTLSIIPGLVEKDALLKANSLFISAESASLLICPLLAGLIILKYGFSYVIFIDICLFFISLLILSRISIEDTVSIRNDLRFVVDDIKLSLKLGFSFIVNDKKLMGLLTLSGIVNFIFSFTFITFIPMVLIISHNDTQILGSITSLASAAQLLTTLFVAHFFNSRSPLSVMIISIILMGLFGPIIIGINASPIFWTIGYAITLSLLALINSSNNSYWQMHTPKNLQGTIFGIRRMISSAITPIGTVLSGPLISFLMNFYKPSFVENEYQIVFLFSGFLILLLGIVGFSLNTISHRKNNILLKNE